MWEQNQHPVGSSPSHADDPELRKLLRHGSICIRLLGGVSLAFGSIALFWFLSGVVAELNRILASDSPYPLDRLHLAIAAGGGAALVWIGFLGIRGIVWTPMAAAILAAIWLAGVAYAWHEIAQPGIHRNAVAVERIGLIIVFGLPGALLMAVALYALVIELRLHLRKP
jgi:hypothetical protein